MNSKVIENYSIVTSSRFSKKNVSRSMQQRFSIQNHFSTYVTNGFTQTDDWYPRIVKAEYR